MIKIKIVAVGKVKEKYFQEAVLEYKKRLSRFCCFEIVEIKEENFVIEPNDSEINKIITREGEGILKEIKGYAIAMAIEGKKYSSKELSKYIAKVGALNSEITFVIGGSYGLSQEVKNRCNELMSMSDMTFPHTLERVMLTEQIYRAVMISTASKYHK